MVCRHEFQWSERRQLDRCHKCGKERASQVSDTPAAPAAPVALRSEPAEPSDVMTSQPAVMTRQERLRANLDQLASGRPLTRIQTLETVLALIEDTQSSEPLLNGQAAASYYAGLHAELEGPRAIAS